MLALSRPPAWKIILSACVLGAASLGTAFAQTAAESPLPAYHVQGDAIPLSLTGRPGDAAEGRKVVEDRKLGNCLSCHAFPIPAEDQGNIGPDLRDVGARLTPAQLRLRVVNMKVLDPQTIMPAYYRVAGLHDVSKAFAGKPILSAQQIEDLVAFLASIKPTGAIR